MSARQAGQLMSQRRFLPLFILLQTGTFNDNVLKNALIGLITFGGVAFLSDWPSALRVPVAGMIFTFPFLLVSAIAGQIADKVDRATILKRIKLAEIFIMIVAALGFLTGNIWILSFALACMGAQSGFFSPTKNAVLPQWLSDEELITGNAILNGFVFVFILVGMVFGLFLVGLDQGPKILSALLLVMALIGWLASRQQPIAPPPRPELKINYEPVSATWRVISQAFQSPHVLRPMLGIAWFYGSSTIMITTLPNYVGGVMGYDRNVLILMLVISTIGILIGSLLCTVLAKGNRWGKESIGLSALGIVGLIIFTLDFYFNLPTETVAPAAGEFAGLDVYWASDKAHRLLVDLFGASVFSGMFVVPMQAMAQRRADPAIRARLMAAGAVLLNIFVNFFTFSLIFMAAREMPDRAPFLIIVAISLFVAIYTVYRTFNPHDYHSYVGEG